MIIYFLMFVYVFVIGTMGKNYILSNGIETKYDSNTTKTIAVLTLLLPVFFIGMRTNYIDTKGYVEGFNALGTSWDYLCSAIPDSKGAGWVVYEWIIKRFITQNPNAFLMITAIIQAGAVLKIYYKYSKDYSYSILLFFLSCSFVNMMNGIRQFLAVALILYFSDYIFEKKYLRFIIVGFIAYTIHLSAIVWILAIFIVQGKPWNIKTIILSLMIILSIFSLDSFTSLLEDSLSNTEYSGYTNQFTADDGSNIAHTLVALVPVAISYIGRNTLAEINDDRINVMVNISIIGAMISLLANFTSGILIGRMPIYFTIFNFALLPWLFEKVFSESNGKTMRMLCIVGYAAYALYYMLHAWGDAGMPYISDILGINTWK